MILTAIHGFCMALADSVPGVSGGTIAFILGFYDRFLNALHSLFGKDADARKSAIIYLLKLGLGWIFGMGACVLTLSRLFEAHIYFMSSLFLGLTLASFPFVLRAEKKFLRGQERYAPFTLFGLLLVVLLTLLRANTVGVAIRFADAPVWMLGYIFLSGAVAITAMVLPGISSSTILLIAGVYLPAIQAIRAFLGFDFSVFPGLLISPALHWASPSCWGWSCSANGRRSIPFVLWKRTPDCTCIKHGCPCHKSHGGAAMKLAFLDAKPYDKPGFDAHAAGTGKIGRIFAQICTGFGMRVLAYDKSPNPDSSLDYVELPELLRQADVISLHCPLTDETRHMIGAAAIVQMKDGAMLVNTSRGGLVDTEALIKGLRSRKVGAACLDVYEEEGDLFYEDCSGEIVSDDTLVRLIAMPNVLVTSHQAFLTKEALDNIAAATVDNLLKFQRGEPSPETEVCYSCERKEDCRRVRRQTCF